MLRAENMTMRPNLTVKDPTGETNRPMWNL